MSNSVERSAERSAERLERLAKNYMNSSGCSLATARQRVREALGRPETANKGYGSRKGRGGSQASNRAAFDGSDGVGSSGVGGIKADRADCAAVILDRAGLSGYVREVRFHPVRRWRLDFMWGAQEEAQRVALEIEGRLPPWVDGKNVSHHTSWNGYENDCVKYSEAAIMGIAVIRCTTGMMWDGRMVDLVSRALEGRRTR